MPAKIFRILWVCLLLTHVTISHAQTSLLPLSDKLAEKFTTQDTLFAWPYVDLEEWRDKPVSHRYVHGGFKGTGARFSLYFPPKENYQGRFFQYITPFPDSENLSQGASGEEDKIGFAITHGSYFIETNGGGRIDFAKPGSNDPTLGAFRVNAATAQFSRVIANQIYDGKRPYGYAFGGSGGAYRTVGSIENTNGVWDGVVPYVLGSPMAIPNVFTVRMHAMRILKDKFPAIIDALEPGGSGDMYATLNQEEKEALLEVTSMGFPPKSWFGYKKMGIHGFLVLYQGVVGADKSYFEKDFWNTPGYLGANPTASLIKARIQQPSQIKAGIAIDEAVRLELTQAMSPTERGTADAAWKVIGGVEKSMPVAFQLTDALPDIEFLGGDLLILSGAGAGKVLQITKIQGDKVVLGPADAAVLAQIKPGDRVQVDNSNFLAVQTFHRHQIPGKEYYVYDQFRDKEGKPIYPQRQMLLGPLFTRGAAGVLPTGKFTGKMILLESLWDREAFPWQADWYRSKVQDNLGDKLNDHFRLWYTDHALHGDIAVEDDPTRTVGYLGVLQQALLDLSAWVEKDIAPAATTSYTIEDGQVIVPQTANERKGIQPVVTLMANGGKRTEIKAGQSVTFTAEVEVPEKMGQIVAAAWNFEGLPKEVEKRSGWSFEDSDEFPVAAKIFPANKTGSKATIKTTYQFSKPGTYFPTLRVASQRDGDGKTPYTRIQNLDRVRVVVK
ncbi:hypothetical protein [Dyadobacter pollutisoli]|uniref:PKD domain-containing protein n=1 Tax=Dyadobacter pollutisoli TaxID=2910158 RepID=A0A9E8SJ74_9BACT|nr:hypothetical protein [Dyadobacter pollutisoli]WAC10593.1 hypothetical protein ON006_22955 [Dyadobacter pollutisoli]